MKLRSCLLSLLFIGLTLSSYAQMNEELERRNGFKDILLGSPVDSVKGATYKKDLKENNEFPVQLYLVEHPDYERIGEVKVKKLELKTYQGMIYEIDVITVKDPRLMKGLEMLYGKAKYIVPTDSYNWVAPSLSLVFKDHSKKEIRLRYRSYPVLKKMLEDKGKKIDAIAEDF